MSSFHQLSDGNTGQLPSVPFWSPVSLAGAGGAGGGGAGTHAASAMTAPATTAAIGTSPRLTRLSAFLCRDLETTRPYAACVLASIPSPNSSNLGPFHMYGVLLAIGVVVAVVVAEQRWRRRGYGSPGIADVSFWVVIW